MQVKQLTMAQLIQLIKLHGGGGGGLDCATCDGDDLAVTGDLTVSGRDIIIKYDDNNYVTLTVNPRGDLVVTPTTNSGEEAKIEFKSKIQDKDGNIVESAQGAENRVAGEVLS